MFSLNFQVTVKEYRNVSVIVPDDQNNTPDQKTKNQKMRRQTDNNVPDEEKTRKIVLKLVDVVKTRYRPVDCKQITTR